MLTKDSYREYFAECRPYVKFSKFLKDCNISSGQFSLFMRGSEYNWTMAIERLDVLYNHIHEVLGKIA